MVAQALERSSLSHPAQPFWIRSIGMTQDARRTIWIYGDSFAVHWAEQGWVYLLGQLLLNSHRLQCQAQGGEGVLDAVARYRWDRSRKLIQPGDPIIWMWSERHRVFRARHRRSSALWPDFQTNWVVYPAVIRDTLWHCRDQGNLCLNMWAFPSTWPNCTDPYDRLQLPTWVDSAEFVDINPDQYGYIDLPPGSDEIRPALFWYAIRDESYEQRRREDRDNPNSRPNHIKDHSVHEMVAQQVYAWVQGQWRGIRDLRTVELNNHEGTQL